ncbi:MAG TPA: zinc ribbon domain-containing protein [Blastocatellia bacterium]|nr:zinc ribbon domain-containing protein [Blastocatellia bacterium]
MPIYEYVCEKCGAHHEVMQKVSDPPLKRCSKCRGKLEKMVSRTSFQLKGSGWYMTDYSSKSSGSGSDAPSTEKSDGAKPAKETGNKTKSSGSTSTGKTE